MEPGSIQVRHDTEAKPARFDIDLIISRLTAQLPFPPRFGASHLNCTPIFLLEER